MSQQQDNFEEFDEAPNENIDDPLLEEMDLKEREFWEPDWVEDIAEDMADQRLEDKKILERGRDSFRKDKAL